jgi:hypothetical protein
MEDDIEINSKEFYDTILDYIKKYKSINNRKENEEILINIIINKLVEPTAYEKGLLTEANNITLSDETKQYLNNFFYEEDIKYFKEEEKEKDIINEDNYFKILYDNEDNMFFYFLFFKDYF